MSTLVALRYAEHAKARTPLDSTPSASRKRQAIRVKGVVQGVGFRPFVYRLATEGSLAGHIGNDTEGVTIEIEGPEQELERFVHRLKSEAPPLSRIDAITIEEQPLIGEEKFTIVTSQVLGQVATGIPADAATCPDCLRELLDPSDRRYRYPFLNCTNCGPRFTITRRIPYDRPQTSMAAFPMCPACEAEYHDPLNRRFHAQPNACWDCGPRVWLCRADGSAISPELDSGCPIPAQPHRAGAGDKAMRPPVSQSTIPSEDPVLACIDRLVAGEIMAIKGIGGFHLSVDATNEAAVQRLRDRKHRYGKPLAVMVRDIDAARALCEISSTEEQLLLTPSRPIVLLRARPANGIAPSVAPGIPWLGVFLPYAPLQHLLFADPRVRALVMTSANLSEEPIVIDNDEARSRLADIADAFLMHAREILQRCDDSVAAVVDGAPQLLRRARGYVPLSLDLPFDTPPLLAVGGHLKSVFTLARGRFAYQSQHLGDLENLTGLAFFEESLAHLMHTFEVEPRAVVHDLHPGYLSTSWAREWADARKLPLLAVQHHHAHIVACMAEHALEGPVIGLSLDGTGYGTDARIWGGEVLLCRLDSFERFAHLNYVPMPGGDTAVREPWRMALAHLHTAGIDVASSETLDVLGATAQEARLILRMIERSINAPLTSSLGRLFDAAAAVILRRVKVDYEAQAAIELEGLADDQPDDTTGYTITLEGNWAAHEPLILNTQGLWQDLLRDLQAQIAPANMAARFHAGVANACAATASAARSATGIHTVALSGGVMHNRRLARLMRTLLEKDGFEVVQHRRVSPGDGGLSYGQAAVAAAILKKS